MNKAISLVVLINSLSKSEKRFFRLYSNTQSGDKAYYALFNLMQKIQEIELIYESFRTDCPGKSFDVTVRHLNRVLLDCLVHLRRSRDIQAKLFNKLTKSEILFERGLVDDSLSELKKARKLAELYEDDTIQLLVRRTELRIMGSTNFHGISEKRMVDKQMKLNEVLKYARNVNQHRQLYDILRYRLIYSGLARSDKQKHRLNDLVLSELNLIANSSYKGFETQKLHLLFQATYFLNSGNYKAAIRFYHDLIDLFEENIQLMLKPPVHYFNALKGILESLHSAGLYKEMPYFIDKIRRVINGGYSQEFLSSVYAFIYLSEFSYYLNTGNFDAAEELRNEYDELLFNKISILDLQLQLQLNLNSAILSLVQSKPKNALKSMKKIFRTGKLFSKFPDYKVARLVNLLIQVELGDYDYFESEVNSLKRGIASEKAIYQFNTEKLLFRFIKYYPLPSDIKNKLKIWEKLQKEVCIINENIYERPLLKIFDFVAWIESKLTGISLKEVISKKSEAKYELYSDGAQ